MERMVEGARPLLRCSGSTSPPSRCCVTCPWIVIASGGAARFTAPARGILVLTGLLAVDKASLDMVYALPEAQRRDLMERMESRSGLRQLEYRKIQGMSSDEYEVIEV